MDLSKNKCLFQNYFWHDHNPEMIFRKRKEAATNVAASY